MQNLAIFNELFALGLNPIPVIWDLPTKTVSKYPQHETDIDPATGRPQLPDVKRWLENGFRHYNGIALKLYPPFGMFDFDLKNTDDKTIYDTWLHALEAESPETLNKIAIETTRSGGYHVYIKYPKLEYKIPVAQSKDGEEIISVYTGGLLSFCYPSPNYKLIHNSFEDLQELTDAEFELMVAIAATFHENKEAKPGTLQAATTEYPAEYENICLQFDYKCDADTFESLLNTISLYRLEKNKANRIYFNKKAWVPFLRQGSTAGYSGKVFFNTWVEHEGRQIASSHRLVLFSASIKGFPHWGTHARTGLVWSLSPALVVYYKNGMDWAATVAEIEAICDSVGIELTGRQEPPQEPPQELSGDFPFDTLPVPIQEFIKAHTIQHDYIAAFVLGALSTAIGNSATLRQAHGETSSASLYLAIVAPAGAAKTPAMDVAFSPLQETDDMRADNYDIARRAYRNALAVYKKSKTATEEPIEPTLPQMLIKDATIEKTVNILSVNKGGCCVLVDELSGFFDSMNQYKGGVGGDLQKWLTIWSGGSVLSQRVGRDLDRVKKSFCSIVGGIQPKILATLGTEQNQNNGMIDRWLFVYPKPWPMNGNPPTAIDDQLIQNYNNIISDLLAVRDTTTPFVYSFTEDAKAAYYGWVGSKAEVYNRCPEGSIMRGIISKYKIYCTRLALILQVTEDGRQRNREIGVEAVRNAIKLTEYFFRNMAKVMPYLVPQSPLDNLSEHMRNFYNELTEMFTVKTAIEVGERYGIEATTVRAFISKGEKKIFERVERGRYQKIY